MSEKRTKAMEKLLMDAGAKIVGAAKEHDVNPMEAEYKLMFAIAESTTLIAEMLFEAMKGESK